MRKESFDRKNEKYGADRRFRTHPADRTKRRNVDGRYEEQKPKKRNADRGRVNESRRIKKLRKRKKARFLRKAVAAVFCVAAVIAAVLFLKERFLDENYRAGGLGQAVNGFLKEGKEMYKAKEAYQSIDKTDENADTLKDLLDKNPETWEFVKNYSKMKDASPADTIDSLIFPFRSFLISSNRSLFSVSAASAAFFSSSVSRPRSPVLMFWNSFSL